MLAGSCAKPLISLLKLLLYCILGLFENVQLTSRQLQRGTLPRTSSTLLPLEQQPHVDGCHQRSRPAVALRPQSVQPRQCGCSDDRQLH